MIAVEGGGAADDAIVFGIKLVGFFVGGGGAGPLSGTFVAEGNRAIEGIALATEGGSVEVVFGSLGVFTGVEESVAEFDVDEGIIGIEGAGVSEAEDGGGPVIGAGVTGTEAEPGEGVGIGAKFEGAGELASGVGEPAEAEVGGTEADADAGMVTELTRALQAVIEVGGAGGVTGLEGLIGFLKEGKR